MHYGPALLRSGMGARAAVPAGLTGAAFAVTGYAGLPALRQADPAALHQLAGETMGTTWSVRLANPQFLPLPEARAAIERALHLVVQQMSNWEADSDVSRFNRADAGTWHTLPHEFWTVLDCALHWARASGGAWDPTVGPLVQAWGFGPASATANAETAARMPDAQALAQARAAMGHERIRLNADQRQACQPGGVHLDLSGIAKGYAVDLVVQHLQGLGYTDFLVELGGELRASGQRPDGQPWRVAVASTARGETAPRAIALRGMAIATSGDHYHAFDHAGRRYSHTIDPRTGEPVSHALTSVTVLHAECMQADALATVLTVLGPQEGLAFAERHALAALLCEDTPAGPVVAMTPAFAALCA